jgi:hypothetical protein
MSAKAKCILCANPIDSRARVLCTQHFESLNAETARQKKKNKRVTRNDEWPHGSKEEMTALRDEVNQVRKNAAVRPFATTPDNDDYKVLSDGEWKGTGR